MPKKTLKGRNKVRKIAAKPQIEERANLYVTSKAYNKMISLVVNFGTEIGWHGLARRVGKYSYEIYDVVVYPQEVTGMTIIPDEGEYGFWAMSQPEDVFRNLRMQGHSHVDMACHPSPTDREFYAKLLKGLPDDSFYIFMILNKRGDSWVQIYDNASHTTFQNDMVRRRVVYYDPIVEEAREVVREKTYKKEVSYLESR